MPVQLTLYTRTDCHLCEDMEHALSRLADEFDFMTDIILIENNTVLERAYGERVPVLMLEEEMICEHFFDRDAFDKVIALQC